MAATFSASLSGDFAAIDAFGAKVARLGSNATLRGVARAIGEAALFQVQLGFSTQTDPYGTPWKPKVFPDGNPVLTGAKRKLRVGWYLKYTGPDAAIIGSRTPYAHFHQLGTGVYGPTGQRIKPKKAHMLSWKSAGGRFAFKSVRGVPPRMMVPRKGDMPLSWNRAITEAAREYLRARMNDR